MTRANIYLESSYLLLHMNKHVKECRMIGRKMIHKYYHRKYYLQYPIVNGEVARLGIQCMCGRGGGKRS